MILDSSVIVAILRAEPEAREFSQAIASAQCHISAANYLEAAVVIDSGKSAISSRRFDDFFRASRVAVIAVTPQQAEIAQLLQASGRA